MDLIQCTVVFILSSSHKGREREKIKEKKRVGCAHAPWQLASI